MREDKASARFHLRRSTLLVKVHQPFIDKTLPILLNNIENM